MKTQEDIVLALPPENADVRAARGERQAAQVLLEIVRREVAAACLGARPGARSPAQQRSGQVPISVVSPKAIAGPARPSTGSTEPVLPLPKQPSVPLIVVSCDAIGCWASDGSRMPRVGPSLLGPKGLCAVQGSVLACP